MESEIRIKASFADMRKAFDDNSLYSIRYYEAIETVDFDEKTQTDICIYRTIIRHKEIDKEFQNRVYTLKGVQKFLIENGNITKPTLEIVKILNYTIPLYGSCHYAPYASLMLKDHEGNTFIAKIEECDDKNVVKYKGFKYRVKNVGSLHSPSYVIN